VTTSKTTESPFKSDNTASNRCGFTLMNNQVGAVVAQVMAKKPNVTVTFLPSMIRVDAVGKMEVDYDEISDALGEEPGYFDAAEFEENMSTHYGRMIHLDDRTIISPTPRKRPSTWASTLRPGASNTGLAGRRRKHSIHPSRRHGVREERREILRCR
jgi:propane monooxygenase coupling protein